MTQHLNEDEINLYRARTLSPEELLRASNHLAECEACRHRIALPAELHSLEGQLRESLRSSLSSPHLQYQQLADYVDHALSSGGLGIVQSHLRECAECAGEIAELEALKAELLSRDEKAEPAAPSNVAVFPTTRRWERKQFFWMACAASIALALAGGFLWQRARQNTPAYLLAAAYTEARPFEYRLGDHGYSPIRQHRAAEGGSALDKPNTLLRAETEIAQELKDAPEASNLLLLRGRAELLEQEYDSAIESLTRAQELKPADPSILADLGAAYALRGSAQNRPIDYGHAIDLLRQSLAAKPGQPIVLFNLALVYERMALFDEAADTWRQYLPLEKDPGWTKEASRHLEDLEALKKKREHARELVKPDPAAFLALAQSDPGGLNPELFQDIAWRYWLPEMAANPSAREAFHTLAQFFANRLHDTSLLDAWNSAIATPDAAPLATLADAMEKNAAAQFEDAFPLARDAAQALLKNGNTAAALRARVELAISRQRTSAGDCLAVAGPLVKDLELTSYIWMHGQALLEQSVCHKMGGSLELENDDLQKASEMLQRGPFPILQLRAQGFLGDLSRAVGNLVAVWEIDDHGLQKCWQFGAPPQRCQQFDFDLGETSKGLGWDQTAAVFAKASVRELSLTGAKPIEAVARVYAAANTSHVKDELAHAEATLSGPKLSPTNQNLLLDARLTRAETAPPELPATRAELKQLEPALALANWDLRVRLKQALGRSLAASGDATEATRSFREAIAEQQRELPSVPDPFVRIARTETAAPAYKGLLSIQLTGNNDPTGALATWDAYRSGWLKQASSPPPAHLFRGVRLVYIALPEGVAAFSVHGNTVTGQILKTPTQEIQQLEQRFLRSCAHPESDLEKTRDDARRLYRWLVEPFAPQLVNARSLSIDADSWLAGIPFPALIDANGRYLVEDFAIAMSGAPSLNGGTQTPITSRDPALIVSVPMPGGRIPPLRFAQEETRSVAAQLEHAQVLSGSEASLDAMKAAIRNTHIFHFVGHGWSNAGDGGLILTNGTEPTYLTAAALSHLNWSACSLVVLSACMTGTGEARGPFNPRSLVRAFLASGAHRVVAARWNLDEAATAPLMQRFYASVLNSTLPAESLALAERAVLRDPEYRHPYYWSSFAIFGEP